MRNHLIYLLLFVASGVMAGEEQLVKHDDVMAASVLNDYVVTLKNPLRIPHPANRQLPAKAHAPDFVHLGGLVTYQRGNMLIVRLPAVLADLLRKEPSVLFVQQVWDGQQPLTSTSTATASSSARLTPTTNGTLVTDPATGKVFWSSGNYTYDGSGNIMTVGSDAYTYDSLQRIKTATINAKTETYTYDAFGNLTSKTSPDTTFSLSAVDSGSNRISGYVYDVAGNMKTFGSAQYDYDGLNMLSVVHSSLGGMERFIYTADDERIGVQFNDGLTRWYLRDFDGRLIREFKGAMLSGWWWVQDNIYADGRLVAGERIAPYGGQVHYHLDHLASVRLITKRNAFGATMKLSNHEYYPFGQEQTFLGQEVADFGYEEPDTRKFTSHERDFFGFLDQQNDDYLDYMHAREYNPALGRFLSVDPASGQERALHEPQGWNRYSYVRNNPVRLTDPDGRDWSDFVSALGDLTDRAAFFVASPALRVMSGIHNDNLGQVAVGQVETLAMATPVGDLSEFIPLAESTLASGATASVVEGVVKVSTLEPGPYAVESIPAHTGRPTAAEQRQVNGLMAEHGCHTCGTKNPGTKSGNAIADHQPPQALGDPKKFLPHCNTCKARQGGQVLQQLRKKIPEDK